IDVATGPAWGGTALVTLAPAAGLSLTQTLVGRSIACLPPNGDPFAGGVTSTPGFFAWAISAAPSADLEGRMRFDSAANPSSCDGTSETTGLASGVGNLIPWLALTPAGGGEST